MKKLESPLAVILGITLIVAANAMILGSAFLNRRGEPKAELELTERELALPVGREEENTALFLSITLGDRPPGAVTRSAWARGTRLPPIEHPWLEKQKLRSLGFRIAVDPADPTAEESYAREGSARVFVVLEQEGEAWRRFLLQREEKLDVLRKEVGAGAASKKELENGETLFALDRTIRSRLMPVDAGRDPEVLARQYPDRHRYAILRGVIEVFLDRAANRPPSLGTKIDLLIDGIEVTRAMRPRLEPFLPRETRDESLRRLRQDPQWPAPSEPRYRARLAIGWRYEPWLVSVNGGDDSGMPPAPSGPPRP